MSQQVVLCLAKSCSAVCLDTVCISRSLWKLIWVVSSLGNKAVTFAQRLLGEHVSSVCLGVGFLSHVVSLCPTLFPPPGDLPDSGIEPVSPAVQADFIYLFIFTIWATREAPLTLQEIVRWFCKMSVSFVFPLMVNQHSCRSVPSPVLHG